MTIGNFTVEEINLIAMYLGETRTDTIMQIAEAVPHMDDDMITIAEGAIRKLAMMDEQEHANNAFVPADDTDE
jgi:3-hydroxy-3-methylglutaryl CoA synthase